MTRRIILPVLVLCFMLQLLTACEFYYPDEPSVIEEPEDFQDVDTIYPEWKPTEVYTIGQILVHDGKYYRVLWWTKGNEPKPDIAHDEWEYLGSIPAKETIYFNDVHNSVWYAHAINTLASAGIFEDTEIDSSNFLPSRPVTRGLFAVMLCHALNIDPVNSGPNFADAGRTWYTPYLAALKQNGMASGTKENHFQPDRYLSRQEMCKLIYDACDGFAEDPATAFAPYVDADNVAAWAIRPMSWCIERRIVNGRGPHLLPEEIASRAEAAQSIYNLIYRPQT